MVWSEVKIEVATVAFQQNKWLSNDGLRCMRLVGTDWSCLHFVIEMHEWRGMSPHAGVKWKPGKEGRGVVILVWSILRVGGAHFTMCGRWCVLHVVAALSLPPQDASKRSRAQEEIKRVCE